MVRTPINTLFAILLSLTLLVAFIPAVSGELDQETRVFIQAENSKIVAQTQSKIDQAFNNIDNRINVRLETMEQRIEEQVTANLIGSLKSLAIGMFGMILVGLAAFKIIEYRLSNMRRIKQYEEELVRQQREADKKMADAEKLAKEAEEKLTSANTLFKMVSETTGAGQSTYYGPLPNRDTLSVSTPSSSFSASPRLSSSPATEQKKSRLPWVIGGLMVIFLIIGVIFFLLMLSSGRRI